jgi:hypothetical protein
MITEIINVSGESALWRIKYNTASMHTIKMYAMN